MQLRTRLVLVNCAVAAALLFKLHQGASIRVVLVTAAIMFTLVNVIIAFAARRLASRPRS